MKFDCTQPLEEKLEEYMRPDLESICVELATDGVVYEGQFVTLNSMVCKKNATALAKLFARILGELDEGTEYSIWYTYDSTTCNFVFYNQEKYKGSDVIKLSIDYHTEKEAKNSKL